MCNLRFFLKIFKERKPRRYGVWNKNQCLIRKFRTILLHTANFIWCDTAQNYETDDAALTGLPIDQATSQAREHTRHKASEWSSIGNMHALPDFTKDNMSSGIHTIHSHAYIFLPILHCVVFFDGFIQQEWNQCLWWITASRYSRPRRAAVPHCIPEIITFLKERPFQSTIKSILQILTRVPPFTPATGGINFVKKKVSNVVHATSHAAACLKKGQEIAIPVIIHVRKRVETKAKKVRLTAERSVPRVADTLLLLDHFQLQPSSWQQ